MSDKDPPAPNSKAPDKALLEILVCPVTRTPLRYDAEAHERLDAFLNLDAELIRQSHDLPILH